MRIFEIEDVNSIYYKLAGIDIDPWGRHKSMVGIIKMLLVLNSPHRNQSFNALFDEFDQYLALIANHTFPDESDAYIVKLKGDIATKMAEFKALRAKLK